MENSEPYTKHTPQWKSQMGNSHSSSGDHPQEEGAHEDGPPRSRTPILLMGLITFVLCGTVGYQAYQTHTLTKQVQRLTELQNSDNSVSLVVPGAPSTPQSQSAPITPNLNRGFPNDWGLNFGDPAKEIQQLQERMNELFGRSFGHLYQGPKGRRKAIASAQLLSSVNIEEKPNAYVVHANIPQSKEASLKANVEGSSLRISGETHGSTETKDKNGTVTREERYSGNFERIIPLPGPVDASKMKSVYENGVFTITLPKEVA